MPRWQWLAKKLLKEQSEDGEESMDYTEGEISILMSFTLYLHLLYATEIIKLTNEMA